ncbi:MAG: xanthine dehydrogenase family protein molybdopterin-binding subunit [Actinobacteria bacterium]|nr:MAG: xanthine dehydrogenase family protein molybdopterin-binding subunit [Actinomycetota bacterium]
MASVIGRRVLRVEDDRFLTGAGTYVEALELPNALHLTFVRSPYPHARVLGIDASAALELPNTQVFTAADIDIGVFPPPPMPMIDKRMARPFVAGDVVRFAGEIVAVVATEDRTAGADAAELVMVDYDPLPATPDPRRALAGEVELFPEHGTNVCMREGPDELDESLFDGCEVVVSGTVVSQRLAPVPMEVRSTAGFVGDDDRLTMYLTTQTPHQDRAGLARFLRLEPGEIRVVAPDVGGGFGAKTLCVEDVLVAWMARKTGRPVRFTETRSENLAGMVHARDAILEVTIGGSKDGAIEAYRLQIIQNVGAYAGIGAFLPHLTGLMASGVYAIPKIEVQAHAVVTNTTPVGPFRGAGRPEAAQAIERAVDLLAGEIGVDPAEVRRRNFIQPGVFPFKTASGATYDSGNYEGALDLALAAADYDGLRERQRRRRADGSPRQLGIGLSTYVEITNGFPEGEFGDVEITPEGGAILRTGSFSHGQGHETTFAMIVAHKLGLPVEAVRVVKGDTDTVARGTGTYGSKSTQIGGAAAALAAEEVVETGRRLAADYLEISVDDIVLDLEAGRFHGVGAPAQGLSWAELAARLETEGRLDELHVEHDFQPSSPTFPFGAHVAVVEVDTETGDVELMRLVAVDDAGTLINPVIAHGQVHGGVATGVSQALYEEIVYDEDANLMTANLVNYAFPSAAELPSFDVVEMETPTPINALGAKGIGESGTIGATPAVQNAVVDALAPFGVRHVDMPANGERVWRALQDANSGSDPTV